MLNRVLAIVPPKFPAFFMVGGVGFAVDAIVLMVLVHGYGWGEYTGRLLSCMASVTSTWLLNSNFVFASGKVTDRRREYVRYLGLQGVTATINYSVYAVCLISSPVMLKWPVLGVAVGSAVGLVFNFLGARNYVFSGRGSLS